MAAPSRSVSSDTIRQSAEKHAKNLWSYSAGDRTRGRVRDTDCPSATGSRSGIIGPVHAKGVSARGRINLEDLFREIGFGMLDALRFEGDDHQSELWVTTRSLVNAWVPPTQFGLPRDLDSAWRKPEFYTAGTEADVAVYPYGSIALPDAKALGVVEVMMIRLGQDDSPLPPDKLLVTVARGRTVMIVEAPIAVTIPVPHAMATVRR